MSPTDTSAATQAETLSLVVVFERPSAEQQLTVMDFSNALGRLAELVVLATYFKDNVRQGSIELVEAARARSIHVEVLRLSYASPVEISLAVASGAALQILIYGVKRLYGIDLELMAYRTELRAQYLEAKERVRELEATAEKPSWAHAIEHDLEMQHFPPLQAESAVLSDEES
jgi:hypothetical protein